MSVHGLKELEHAVRELRRVWKDSREVCSVERTLTLHQDLVNAYLAAADAVVAVRCER